MSIAIVENASERQIAVFFWRRGGGGGGGGGPQVSTTRSVLSEQTACQTRQRSIADRNLLYGRLYALRATSLQDTRNSAKGSRALFCSDFASIYLLRCCPQSEKLQGKG